MTSRLPEFLKQFEKPDSRWFLMPVWRWNARELDARRLCWQMEQMRAMGIEKVVVRQNDSSADPGSAILSRVRERAAAIGLSIELADSVVEPAIELNRVRGWSATLADVFDDVLASLQSGGIRRAAHAIYYTMENASGTDAIPIACWRQPYARHYRAFAKAAARLTKLLSQGELLSSNPGFCDSDHAIHRKIDDVNVLLILAPVAGSDDTCDRQSLSLPVTARSVWRYDPADNSARRLAVSKGQDVNQLELDVEGAPFVLLLWSDEDDVVESEPRAHPQAVPLSPQWTMRYVATLSTRFIDTHDPDRPELALPHTPERLCSRVGDALSWAIPPGACDVLLRLHAGIEAMLSIDDQIVPIPSDGLVPIKNASRATLSVRNGRSAGDLLRQPVTYRFEEAPMRLGSWIEQGLRSYSGIIRMRQRFNWTAGGSTGAVLDLGQVRGSVEAKLNGVSLGVRFIPPFRFDLSHLLQPGENELELEVANTLATLLSTSDSTLAFPPDQIDAGVFGPVLIRR